jgi:drug/metabolite transporter (DMT)-like permease
VQAAGTYLKLHLVVFLWGFTAILGVLISVSSVTIVFYRTLLAALGLGMLLYVRNRSFHIGKMEVVRMLATGFIISLHWILFFGAAKVATASVCLAGMATTSLWTSFIEPIFYKRKVWLFEVLLGMVALAGLYVIFRFEFDHAIGLVMALASAMLAALFTVINSQFTQRHNPYMITFYEMIGAWVGTALFLLFYTVFWSDNMVQIWPSANDWFYLLILAGVCTVYAYSASVELMQKISAFALNLTNNLEPVYGIFLAFLIFGEKEKMTIGFYLGTGIILLAVLAYPLVKRMLGKKIGMNGQVTIRN